MEYFMELAVWQKARQLTKKVYEVTRSYPHSEQFGLTSQTRRAAVSIAANIAEGSGKGSKVDFSRMLQIARGEAAEIQSHLVLAGDLGMLKNELVISLQNDAGEIKKMITGLIKSLEQKPELSKAPELGL